MPVQRLCQRNDYSLEEVILFLLFNRQSVVSNIAWMPLLVRVFDRAILPAFSFLDLKPRVVARAGRRIRIR